MKRILLSMLSVILLVSSCSKPAEGQDLAKSACEAWQTAWSNSLRMYIGDARSQYYDFNAAYEIAKSASEINEEWQPITNAISNHTIYLLSQFNRSFFPDTKKQVKGMDICKKLGIDVNG